MTWVAAGGSIAAMLAEGALAAGAATAGTAAAGTAAAGIGAGTAAAAGAGALGAGGLAAASPALMPAGMGAVGAAPALAAPAVPTVAAPAAGGGFLGTINSSLDMANKMAQPIQATNTLKSMLMGPPAAPPQAQALPGPRGMQLPPAIDPSSLVVSSRGAPAGGMDQMEILKRLGLM